MTIKELTMIDIKFELSLAREGSTLLRREGVFCDDMNIKGLLVESKKRK